MLCPTLVGPQQDNPCFVYSFSCNLSWTIDRCDPSLFLRAVSHQAPWAAMANQPRVVLLLRLRLIIIIIINIFHCYPSFSTSIHDHPPWSTTCRFFLLVGALEHQFHVCIQWGISWSQLTDSYFFRGVAQPPTSNSLVTYFLLVLTVRSIPQTVSSLRIHGRWAVGLLGMVRSVRWWMR